MIEPYDGNAQVRVDGGEWIDVDNLQYHAIALDPAEGDPATAYVTVRKVLPVTMSYIVVTIRVGES